MDRCRNRDGAEDSRRDIGAEAAPLVAEFIAQINNIGNAIDANKDGKIGWQTGEGGLDQANQHMRLMMKGEGL